MRQVKVFRFSGGFVSGVDLDGVTDTISKWIKENGVQMINVSIASGHAAVLFAPVIYEVADGAGRSS